MNLGELRLKALQSLKRSYSSTSPTNETAETVVKEAIEVEATQRVTEETVATQTDSGIINGIVPMATETSLNDREEGEITDDSGISISELENDSNSSNEYQKFNKRFGYSKMKPRNTTWTRSGYRNNESNNSFYNYLSDESDPELTEINDKFDLDSLINFKINLLSKIDESLSILSASEDKEHDLLDQLQECRNLRKKCENERFLLERKLEKIEKRINFKEIIKFNMKKEEIEVVSKNNFKKNFVGKMLKETWMRSFGDRFRSSSLFRIYNETLKLDRRAFNRIDPMTPFCSIELTDGKCPYYSNGTCSMQHIEEIMKKSEKDEAS